MGPGGGGQDRKDGGKRDSEMKNREGWGEEDRDRERRVKERQ